MKKKTLKKKIISKIVLMGSLTFILVMILSYFMLIIPLNKRFITDIQATNMILVHQTDYLLSYIRDYSNMITINEKIKKQYIYYVNNPSENARSSVNLALSELVSQWKNVNGVIIEIEGGEIFESIGNLTDTDRAIMDGEWYTRIRNTDYASGFSKMYEPGAYGGIYAAAYSKNYYIYGKRFTATLFFNASEIVYAMNNLFRDNADAYMWIGEDNEPFYLAGNGQWSRYIVREIENITIWDNLKINGRGGINIITSSKISGWKFVSYNSYASIFKAGAAYILNIIATLVLFYLFAIVFIVPVVNNAVKPINKLARTMQEVSRGNLNIRAEINTQDEIEEVSRVFNNMVRDLNTYIKELILKEKSEQKIRYSLLASQIDLHFIFNTMNRINYLAKRGEYEEIILVNTALIKIMKDSLRFNHTDIMDTVYTETNVVKQYLTIIGSHYNDVVDVEWDIDEQLLDLRIPKNIIQPLVENAIFHGLINEQGEIRGKVSISIQTDDKKNIVICVGDNGNGMSDASIQTFRENYSTRTSDRGQHIGLNNIKWRLNYLFGDKDCLKIESRINEGTRVTLIFRPDLSGDHDSGQEDTVQ